MTPGLALAEAAATLVGCPFRANGRDPEHGLDCIGLLQVSLTRIGQPCALPSGYRLRTGNWAGLGDRADALGFEAVSGMPQPGDVCLYRPSPLQMHFAIADASGLGFIEAHAGLRRIVITPAPYPHALAGLWRLKRHI